MDNRPLMTLEAAQDFKSSRNWELLCNEMDLIIESLEHDLRACSPEQLVVIQVRIKDLEELKALPDAIIHREEE